MDKVSRTAEKELDDFPDALPMFKVYQYAFKWPLFKASLIPVILQSIVSLLKVINANNVRIVTKEATGEKDSK